MIFLQTGSNEGNRQYYLDIACEKLSKNVSIERKSGTYETAAWGLTNQASFYNQILQVHSTVNPYELLRICQDVENEIGRVRNEKWGPRIIDIDIIFYGNKIIFSPELKIPHPHMKERRFVLVPLCDIAPLIVDPVSQKTVERLLQECGDKSEVKRTS